MMRKRRETIRDKGVQDRISDGGERATKMKVSRGRRKVSRGRRNVSRGGCYIQKR
jgi:hypothetical protein